MLLETQPVGPICHGPPTLSRLPALAKLLPFANQCSHQSGSAVSRHYGALTCGSTAAAERRRGVVLSSAAASCRSDSSAGELTGGGSAGVRTPPPRWLDPSLPKAVPFLMLATVVGVGGG